MIYISDNLQIDERDVQITFIHASGPGGQNVNKVATAVQLRFNVLGAPLPEDVRQRLMQQARGRINKEGILVIDARRFRTQDKNRQEALNRLVLLIRKATERPKHRHKTTPTLASQARRLEVKRRRAKTKYLRRSKPSDE
jgi:ribosome-associated protein